MITVSRTVWAMAAVSIASIVFACSSGSSQIAPQADDAGATDASAPADAGDDATASVTGGSTLALGGATVISKLPIARSVSIPLTRTGSPSSPVTVTLSGFPTGVTAAPLSFAGGSTTAMLTLSADNTAVLGTMASIKLAAKATNSGATANAIVQISIIGTPGTLDASWGTQGVSAGLGQGAGQITGLGFQKNGAIVVGGFVGAQIGVGRYTSAGVLDTGFGTAGTTLVSVPSTTGRTGPSRQLAVDSGDRVFIGAQFSPGAQGDIACFSPTGVIDTTFNGTGFGGPTNSSSGTTAVDALDKPFLGGAYQGSTLVRLTTAGVADTTFGQFMNGVTTVEGPGYDTRAIAVQTTGRIITVGHNATPAGFIGGVSGIGTVDTTFAGGSGKIDGSNAHAWEALAIDSKDAIFAAGQEALTTTSVVVGRVTKDGAFDPAFGTSGIVTHAAGDAATSAKATAIAVQKDGRVVVAGSATSGGRPVMLVMRLLADGTLDTTFGVDSSGIVYLAPGATVADATSVAIQSDGRILVGGHADNDWAVARLWP